MDESEDESELIEPKVLAVRIGMKADTVRKWMRIGVDGVKLKGKLRGPRRWLTSVAFYEEFLAATRKPQSAA